MNNLPGAGEGTSLNDTLVGLNEMSASQSNAINGIDSKGNYESQFLGMVCMEALDLAVLPSKDNSQRKFLHYN